MILDDWLPIYREILASFGYSEDEDRKAAIILARLMEQCNVAGPDELEKLLKGKRVLVVGPARIGENGVKDFDTVIAADRGIENAVYMGLKPEIIVTDLDAPADALKMEFDANRNGAVMVIHAHGDNISALERYLPGMRGPLMGTTQTVPFGRIQNFGGFTDGDRAVTIAAHFGAAEIALAGFDFENPVPKEGMDTEIKRKKMEWARRIIGMTTPQPYILH